MAQAGGTAPVPPSVSGGAGAQRVAAVAAFANQRTASRGPFMGGSRPVSCRWAALSGTRVRAHCQPPLPPSYVPLHIQGRPRSLLFPRKGTASVPSGARHASPSHPLCGTSMEIRTFVCILRVCRWGWDSSTHRAADFLPMSTLALCFLSSIKLWATAEGCRQNVTLQQCRGHPPPPPLPFRRQQ